MATGRDREGQRVSQRTQNILTQSLDGWDPQAAHLGEAELEVPEAAVGGHPLGGLTVLGELQGGSRFMTRRPQAAMLRFIWEALRKSWPRGGRWGSVPPSQWSASPSPHSLHPPYLYA